MESTIVTGSGEIAIIYDNSLGAWRVTGSVMDEMRVMADKVRESFKIPTSITDHNRSGNYALARDAFAHIARECGYQIAEISEFLGQSRRSVYNQVTQAEFLLLHNRKFRELYNGIKK